VRARWATGFIAGPLAAIALLVLPTPGLLLTLVLALVLLKTRGLPALAGMLCGTGAAGLAVLAQANARCDITYAGCGAPNVTTAVAIAVALLIMGVGLTFAQYVRSRARASF
jgi:chromate transport protein ChrA